MSKKSSKNKSLYKKSTNERLMEEYKLAIDLINRLGNNVLTIKGWCITIVAGMIALTESDDTITKGLTIILAFIIFAFWIIEGTYRVVMERFKKRCETIEQYFDSDEGVKNENFRFEKAPRLITNLNYEKRNLWKNFVEFMTCTAILAINKKSI